jgi:hypothetical protein
MRTKSLTSEQMEVRVARLNKLQTYQRQNFEAHNIPPGAVEKVAARRVYPVMAPADYQGRSAGAPVKGPRGLIVLPLIKCSRRIRPIVSTVSIPPHRSLESKRAAHQANLQGVNFGRRSPDSGGQNCTPNDSAGDGSFVVLARGPSAA